MKSCEESIHSMYRSFDSDAAGDLCATYLFDITGPHGGQWALSIKDGKCKLIDGETTNPSVKISISDQDWAAIQSGSLNSQMAFMMGKLKVVGDMSLAMKLQSVFPKPN